MSSSYSALNVTRSADGYIVTVELHRPEALNAMNTAMGQELLHCFDGHWHDRWGRMNEPERRAAIGPARKPADAAAAD